MLGVEVTTIGSDGRGSQRCALPALGAPRCQPARWDLLAAMFPTIADRFSLLAIPAVAAQTSLLNAVRLMYWPPAASNRDDPLRQPVINLEWDLFFVNSR